ncbi:MULTISPECIES: hypothetical protein [Acinetobacter]|jgi:hypothetical protein|uniref:DUF456 domain-containing protein n=2 Tax=Acinetobacter TaxID=469 RepID=A0A4Q7B185_9GAMM|nr:MULTISPECIES: hypothetical protein [Acinetobacter]MCW8039514.1 hypothetical protein [Acinetobacter entericus]RZG69976.1 hypothetical protein EXE25_01455 [Acinetobacter bouvetii]TCB75018.1 hypothetical protein E0H91_08570 [Acinetobacter sp. ANC 4177]
MTTENLSSASDSAPQDTAAETSCSKSSCAKSSKFSPTVKGILIGAVAGSILPVFGTFSGAVIGGIAGKVYQKKCSKPV